MIWYSPELVLEAGGHWWVEAGALDRRIWSCGDRLARYWNIDPSASLWIAVSDTPVRGALQIDRKPYSNRVLVNGKAPGELLWRMSDWIHAEVGTRRLWLWIEVPDDR